MHKLTPDLGTCVTRPQRRWMPKKTQRGGCFPLSLSLSHMSIASPLIGFIHGGPLLNVIMPGSLHLSAFRKSHRSHCFYLQSLFLH